MARQLRNGYTVTCHKGPEAAISHINLGLEEYKLIRAKREVASGKVDGLHWEFQVTGSPDLKKEKPARLASASCNRQQEWSGTGQDRTHLPDRYGPLPGDGPPQSAGENSGLTPRWSAELRPKGSRTYPFTGGGGGGHHAERRIVFARSHRAPKGTRRQRRPEFSS